MRTRCLTSLVWTFWAAVGTTTLGCVGESNPTIKCEKSGCNDGNPCTEDQCVASSGCKHTPTDSGSCNDGSACTTADICKAGACVGGGAVSCDDGNPCTNDACKADSGCSVTANTAQCSDGHACTVGDGCTGGSCGHTGLAHCDDGKPCTDDTCEPVAGCVVTLVEGRACSDGDACTLGDTCKQGSCTGSPFGCDDSNSCTSDTCEPTSGCKYSANANSCDDGSACTKADTCANGKCGGETIVCTDGIGCSDDSCDAKSGCVFAVDATACNDSNVCTTDTCHAKMGCQYAELTGNCEDGNGCTVGDTCVGGWCAGAGVTCDDQNGCTSDVCKPGQGCVNTAVTDGTSCTDGSYCTGADTCKNGKCQGFVVQCDDGSLCTDDSCDAVVGCVHTANSAACSDNNLCTASDTCKDGKCVGGPLVTCDDGNVCTIESCTAQAGCKFTAKPNLTCSDGNKCTLTDMCSAGGSCTGTAIAMCDDANPCTTDSCQPAVGCVYANNALKCNDGDVCTIGDYCKNGGCVLDEELVCKDGNPCQSQGCDPVAGCYHTAIKGPCSDGNACTINDACDGSKCSGVVNFCDDKNPCTGDACDPATGNCLNKALDGLKCDDGNGCTTADACSATGACQGVGKSCDDNNKCTTDSCANNVCSAKPAVCEDGQVCTIDACVALFGCVFSAVATPINCNDGDMCTLGDACQGKVCLGSPVNCDDKNPCTVDACVAIKGCVNSPNTAPCDDGNKCTQGDKCANSLCKGGLTTNCNDANACTDDSCKPTTGCAYTNAKDWKLCTDSSGLFACTGTGICASTATSKFVMPVGADVAAIGCNSKLDSKCPADSKPGHLAQISAVWIDTDEVSNAAFAKCVAAGACTKPSTALYFCTYDVTEQIGGPVNCVTWSQATAYCQWRGMRLPTEHEWEKTARGACGNDLNSCVTDTDIYPWDFGTTSCSWANHDAGGGWGCGTVLPWNAGAGYAGPYGHTDLAGNIAEWTSDGYQANWYSSLSGTPVDPVSPSTDGTRVVRGGSFMSKADGLRSYVRTSQPASAPLPNIGFRCARSIQ